MSDPRKKFIDYSKTSWIQSLSKAELIKTLTQLELVYDKESGIDELRRILRAHVNKVNVNRGQEVSDKKEPHGGVNENNKPRVTHTMAGDNSCAKLEFQLGKDDWETYTERLELYFIANDVKTEKQAAVLLTKISPDTYKLVRDLCAPDKPSTKSYAELVKLVNDHLNPKPSETMERCKFYQTHQTTTESVADFTARLKNLAINCNFGDAKVALRDQLVCGLRDHATKKTLFREEKLTYESAYKIAAAMEEAEKNATSTDKVNKSTSDSAASVNVIQSNSRNDKPRQITPNTNTRGRGVYRGVRRGQRYNNKHPVNTGNRAPHNNTKPQSAGRSVFVAAGQIIGRGIARNGTVRVIPVSGGGTWQRCVDRRGLRFSIWNKDRRTGSSSGRSRGTTSITSITGIPEEVQRARVSVMQKMTT